MTHLVFRFRDGTAYEVTDRHTRPYSSSARHYHHDPYYIRQLITWLPIENHDWRSLLQRISSQPLQFHSNHPGEIYDAAMQAVVRGDLRLYQLPRLGDTHCVPGANNTGLIFIRGPQPHAGTQQKPETIASPQAARQLLDDMAVNHKVLFHRLSSEGLYNSQQKTNPLNDLCQLLAKGDILVYKIPLRPPVKPPKPIEYEDTSGPQFQPVPLLAPEPEPRPAASNPPPAKPAQTAKPPAAAPNQPAQSLDECEQRLGAARERLISDGYQPKYTDEQLQAMTEKGELDDRFVARLIESDYAGDDGYLGQMNNGEVRYWSTTFNQMENADTDPKTLCELIGVDYNPKKSYTLVVVDTHAKGAGQSVTLVPTHKNLGNFTKSEIKGINPEAVDQVMTPEYNDVYAKHVAEINKQNLDIKNDEHVSRYADTNFSTESDKTAFETRTKIHSRLGANEYYTGDGTTKNLITGCPNKSGVMETFTLDKNPKTLSQLEASGGAKRIATKPL